MEEVIEVQIFNDVKALIESLNIMKSVRMYSEDMSAANIEDGKTNISGYPVCGIEFRYGQHDTEINKNQTFDLTLVIHIIEYTYKDNALLEAIKIKKKIHDILQGAIDAANGMYGSMVRENQSADHLLGNHPEVIIEYGMKAVDVFKSNAIQHQIESKEFLRDGY